MIGLGCMRLSTSPARDDARSIAVIHAALDAGVTLLDTADSYAHDDSDIGHNERLIAAALASWKGVRTRVRVATKGGLRRPGGRWLPDGRAKHLRAACEASRRALGVDIIDLYQLHVVDPRVPLETSIRALAALRDDGLIESIGLCNANVSQIEVARAITEIAAVQVSMSAFDGENLRNGVAEYCRDHGIMLIAHRPLGGERSRRIASHPLLNRIAQQHNTTPHNISLAWLRSLHANVVPVPGATRVETARALADVLQIHLTDSERAELDADFPAGRLLRVPRAQRRPANPTGDVVVVMGMPAAGKSSVARELVAQGYQRLNRDELGGRVSDLIAPLADGLAHGSHSWVLDNTYPTRAARNEVIETAWQHGARVRCIHVATTIADAQINAVTRMIQALGHLPSPEELKALGKNDTRFFGPDAQFRYLDQLELPALDEGFDAIETREFARVDDPSQVRRAVVYEFDGVLCTSGSGATAVLSADDVCVSDARTSELHRLATDDVVIAAIAWRPQLSAGATTDAAVQDVFARVRDVTGVPIDVRYCPHLAGAPVCWCRKPLPGLVLALAHDHHVALRQSTLIGRAAADRTLAQRLGMLYREADA